MKKYIRIILPIFLFIIICAFILLIPDESGSSIGSLFGNSDSKKYDCKNGIHNYTVENKCDLCGALWEYSEGLDFFVFNSSCSVRGIGTFEGSELVIPYGYEGKPVTSIDGGAFSGCEQLTKVIMPDSITHAADTIFARCENLQEVVFSKNLQSITNSMFSHCSQLKIVSLNDK